MGGRGIRRLAHTYHYWARPEKTPLFFRAFRTPQSADGNDLSSNTGPAEFRTLESVSTDSRRRNDHEWLHRPAAAHPTPTPAAAGLSGREGTDCVRHCRRGVRRAWLRAELHSDYQQHCCDFRFHWRDSCDCGIGRHVPR